MIALLTPSLTKYYTKPHSIKKMDVGIWGKQLQVSWIVKQVLDGGRKHLPHLNCRDVTKIISAEPETKK